MQYKQLQYNIIIISSQVCFFFLFVTCLIAAATSTSLSEKGPAFYLRQQLQGGTICWPPISECNPFSANPCYTRASQG